MQTLNFKTLFQIFKTVVFLLVGLTIAVPTVTHAAIVPCGGSGQPGCSLEQLVVLADNLIQFLLFNLATPLAIVSFLYGGILMVTARGNDSQIQQAKSIFWYTLIGFICAFGAWLIVEAIVTTLTGASTLKTFLKF